MAILTHLVNTEAAPLATIEAIDIADWTQQTLHALSELSVGTPQATTSKSGSLTIDLDEHEASRRDSGKSGAYRPRKEPLRRDSLKRREALLKGKEGSRRRRQWENDRLLNNPWAQAPLPSDWEVHPTYPKHAVPYYLAPLWDQKAAAKADTREKAKMAAKTRAVAADDRQGRIPREIRGKLKKAKSAKALLRDLEEQVRSFVEAWDAKNKPSEKAELDSEDEEIVFVGRNGHMNDVPPSPQFRDSLDSQDLAKRYLVFDSLDNDQSASFGRWLIHSIATYYGLQTWSVTVGDPERREAYVAIPNDEVNKQPSIALPRPLWGMV